VTCPRAHGRARPETVPWRSRVPDRRERGSAVVEFALLLPIVLLVLLAVVQVGVLGRDRLVLEQAARAGARIAAVDASESAVDDAVRAAATALDGARLTVSVERAGSRGSAVTVTVRYDDETASLLAGWLVPPSVALSATATMRQEFG
jgi:Flp pilus assembly protein TadG